MAFRRRAQKVEIASPMTTQLPRRRIRFAAFQRDVNETKSTWSFSIYLRGSRAGIGAFVASRLKTQGRPSSRGAASNEFSKTFNADYGEESIPPSTGYLTSSTSSALVAGVWHSRHRRSFRTDRTRQSVQHERGNVRLDQPLDVATRFSPAQDRPKGGSTLPLLRVRFSPDTTYFTYIHHTPIFNKIEAAKPDVDTASRMSAYRPTGRGSTSSARSRCRHQLLGDQIRPSGKDNQYGRRTAGFIRECPFRGSL